MGEVRGRILEELVSKCPVCGKNTLKTVFYEQKDVYFGTLILVSSSCSSCGFKHSDVIIPGSGERKRYVVAVGGEEDLKRRVVRGSGTRVEVVEAGVSLEPGPFSDGYITNVEGILLRFLDMFPSFYRNFPERKEEIERAEKIIRNALEGRGRVTLVLEDPEGNVWVEGAQPE